MLEQGPTERRILEQSFKMGGRIPAAIQNAPQLFMGLELYLSAWLDLNSCRNSGMSAGPIPWLAIHEYAKELEFDDDQRESLHYHIVAMDRAYFQHRERERERNKGG